MDAAFDGITGVGGAGVGVIAIKLAPTCLTFTGLTAISQGTDIAIRTGVLIGVGLAA